MAKKKKDEAEDFQEPVNATWGELDKLSELAASYGYNFTGTEIAAWGDVRWGNLKEYLDALDRGDKVATPEWLTELVDAQAEAVGQSHVAGVDEHGDEIFHPLPDDVPRDEETIPEPAPEPVAPVEPSELEALRKTVANLQRQIEYMPLLTPRQQEALEVAEEVGTLYQSVAKAEEKFDDADKAAKSAKKAYESLLKDLQDAAGRLEAITGTGDYQRTLFNHPYRGVTHDEMAAPVAVALPVVDAVPDPSTPVDAGGSIPLTDLTKAGLSKHAEHNKQGLTAKKIDALVEVVGGTIDDLERWLQAGNAIQSIKGFSDEWATRVHDALGVIRDRYPVPEGVVAEFDMLEAITGEKSEPIEPVAELVDELEDVTGELMTDAELDEHLEAMPV